VLLSLEKSGIAGTENENEEEEKEKEKKEKEEKKDDEMEVNKNLCMAKINPVRSLFILESILNDLILDEEKFFS